MRTIMIKKRWPQSSRTKKLEKEKPQSKLQAGKQMQVADRQLLFLHTLQRRL